MDKDKKLRKKIRQRIAADRYWFDRFVIVLALLAGTWFGLAGVALRLLFTR